MRSSSETSKSVLHSLKLAYMPLVDQLITQADGMAYYAHLLEPNLESIKSKRLKIDFDEMFRMYIIGILERCHIACMTSIARTSRWLRSSLNQLEEGNLLGFSASLRGLLEGAADAHDATSCTIDHLYKGFPFIYLRAGSVSNQVKPVLLEELENRLIHYVYAGKPKKGSAPLPHHTNKSNYDYIKAVEMAGAAGAILLYSMLCELTHPAAPSIACFLEESDKKITLSFSQDKKIIHEILNDFESTIENFVTQTVNSALLSLILLKRISPSIPAPCDSFFAGNERITAMLKNIDQFIELANSEGFVFTDDMWGAKLLLIAK
ncbi:hypothetical protein QPL90_11425 [Pseudomonas syringae pv. syringae]|uniref:hypothetical protein n=1 Tax=Pseudomonas syringae TaxID=317 RepID=UPI002E7AFB78|nr:hypothetical protein [Pseudomonas syringae]MEE1992115.1 hypothetical protein [Pseudomonas syringae pv. syringae]MEE1997772.1 hypothetical protein [Pseudomonas syringae pv. syringae]